MKHDKLTDAQLRKVIRAQKRMIRKAGFDADWELFERSFGWFKISKEMSPAMQERYKAIWEGK